MASKSQYKGNERGAEISDLLDAVDKLLDRTKVLYEQYFMGIQKVAPAQLHRDIERRIRELTQMQIRNTALRYRLTTVTQKFGAYNTYWRRTIREIEQGRYVRDLARVRRKAQQRGEDLPEEIIAAMPKGMRDQIRRDREHVAKRYEHELDSANAAGDDSLRGRDLSDDQTLRKEGTPERPDERPDDDASFAEEEATEQHERPEQVREQRSHVHRISEDDFGDDDFDQLFERLTASAEEAVVRSSQSNTAAAATRTAPAPVPKPVPAPAPVPAPTPVPPRREPLGQPRRSPVSIFDAGDPVQTRPAPPLPAEPGRTRPAPPLPAEPATPVETLVRKPAPPPIPPGPPGPPGALRKPRYFTPEPKNRPDADAAEDAPTRPGWGFPAGESGLQKQADPPVRAASGAIRPGNPAARVPAHRETTKVQWNIPSSPDERSQIPGQVTTPGVSRHTTTLGPRIGRRDEGPPPPPPPGMTEKQARALHQRYLQARKMVGESTDVPYERMVKTLSDQTARIMEQHKASTVDFKVVIKNDKVVLTAKPKR